MNTGKIMNIIGRILFVEVLLMLPSLFVSLIYRDGDTKAFVYTMIPAAIVSVLLMLVRQQQKRMSSRDGYFIVAMAWIIISIVGAFPLYLAAALLPIGGHCLKLCLVSQRQEHRFLQNPVHWDTEWHSGGALPIGLAVWECLSLY